MDHSLNNVLFFGAKGCGERLVELGLFLLEFWDVLARPM
jgi:hypothetical protein